jgi:two-component system response regulator HydG
MKKKILVVDDNIDFSANLTDILELKGYEVFVAQNGRQAIDIIKENAVDLILMDIKMPVMNGVEAFRNINRLRPEIPVIMMTAFAVEDLIRDALREGAFGIFYKSFDLDELLQKIEQALLKDVLIMVVDDNRELCAVLYDVLVHKKYGVQIARDGETAIQMARENKFDIVLLDWNLPMLNGLETHLILRDIRPNLVTIIITGYLNDMERIVRHTLKENVYVCLEKPLDMNHLLALVQEITESKNKGDAVKK